MSSSDTNPRTLVYALEPGGYELRMYGDCQTCAPCVVTLRIDTPATLTITPRPGMSVDITAQQPEGN